MLQLVGTEGIRAVPVGLKPFISHTATLPSVMRHRMSALPSPLGDKGGRSKSYSDPLTHLFLLIALPFLTTFGIGKYQDGLNKRWHNQSRSPGDARCIVLVA